MKSLRKWLLILIQYTNVTDGQMDGRLCIALRGNMKLIPSYLCYCYLSLDRCSICSLDHCHSLHYKSNYSQIKLIPHSLHIAQLLNLFTAPWLIFIFSDIIPMSALANGVSKILILGDMAVEKHTVKFI